MTTITKQKISSPTASAEAGSRLLSKPAALRLEAERIQYAVRGLAPFEYRGHHQVRSAHHVAAGEYLGIGGLKPLLRRRRDTHPAVAMQCNPLLGEPARGARQESEGDDHGVRLDGLLRTRHRLRHAPAARVRLTQAGLHQLHTLHAVRSDDFDRLTIEQEVDA